MGSTGFVRRLGAVDRGYTLVELMIVLAIIGVLASVAVPFYANYVNSARAMTRFMESMNYRLAISVCGTDANDFSVCDAGVNGVPSVNSRVIGISAGVMTINLGDIDEDGSDEVVVATPALSGNGTSVDWVITALSGTNVCSSGESWLDNNIC